MPHARRRWAFRAQTWGLATPHMRDFWLKPHPITEKQNSAGTRGWGSPLRTGGHQQLHQGMG